MSTDIAAQPSNPLAVVLTASPSAISIKVKHTRNRR